MSKSSSSFFSFASFVGASLGGTMPMAINAVRKVPVLRCPLSLFLLIDIEILDLTISFR